MNRTIHTAGDITRPWITFFLPNCLLNNVESAETFELDVDNTSGNLPILVNLRFSERIPIALNLVKAILGLELSKKSTGQTSLTEKYVTPLLADLVELDLNESNETKTVSNTTTKLSLKHSNLLFSPGSNRNRKRKHRVYVRLPDDVKAAVQNCF